MNDIIIAALICIGITAVGAFTQRVSGFGMGIVVMTVLPFLFPTFGEATALSGLVGVISTTYLAVKYRKNIQWKLILWPFLAYIPINYFAIWIVAGSDVSLLKRALGVFLVVLSVYFVFFSAKLKIKANTATGIAAGGLSGFLGGAFSMGGPPVVVYLLGATGDDKTAYIATIQCMFALTGYVSTAGRIANGLVSRRVLLFFPLAALGMALGNLIGGRVYKRLDAQMLKKCVYAFMAVAGVIIFVTTL